VVTGFRSSLQKALNLKQQAIGVRDSIVAEDIGKFPEANVAESLQRIPGVYLIRDGSSNEGQRINIRGLGPQYSVTTINGAPVHTTSAGNAGSAVRDFNYDVFASDLFGRVDFYKSPMAELEEGGIGGIVDLQTPRPFDKKGRTIRYSASASYNTASEKLDPRYSVILSNTWGKWGALLGYAHSGSTNLRSGFQSTGGYNSAALGRSNAPSGWSVPFNFDLDYNDPRANLGGLTRQQVDNALLPRFHRVYGNLNKRERDGLVTSLQYKDGALDVSLDGLFSRLKDTRDEYTFGLAIRNSRTTNNAIEAGRPGHNGFVPINVFIDQNNILQGTFGNTSYINESYTYDSKTSFGLGSINAKYTVSDDLKFSASAGRSSSKAFFTNNRIFTNIYGVTSTIDSSQNHVYPVISATGVNFNDPSIYKDPAIGYNYVDEYDSADHLKLVMDWNYNLWGGWTGKLKTGLSYVSSDKQVGRYNGTGVGQTMRLPIGGSLNSLGNSITSYMQQGPALQNFASGSPATFPKSWSYFGRDFIHDVLQPIRAKLATPLDPAASFKTTEEVSSLFVQSDFTGEVFGRALRMNAGVRYARTETSIDNYTQVTENGVRKYVPNSRTSSYSNLLPSFSAAYDLRDDVIVRASLGRTITRAALSLIAANTTIPNPFDAAANSGNPNLKPQISDQVDLTGEWYFQKGSLVSLGLFHKKMKDLTEARRTTVPFSSLGLPDTALGTNFWVPGTNRPDPNLPITLSSYVNASQQKVSGLELAYQQAFTFLPEPFNGLGAMASYTRVKWPVPDWVAPDGSRHEAWEVPRYSYNLTAYYERGPWAVRASYNYRDRNIIGRSEVGVNRSLNGLATWQAGRKFVDASVSYKLNEYLELRLDGMNLTNDLSYVYYKDMLGRYGNDHSRTDNLLYDGRTVQVGLRGKF
jgi:TonB-dependent receptor